jgi:hypothetical protein
MLCGVALADPGIYRWTDEEGAVHFGDRPPANAEAQELHPATRPPPAVPESYRSRPAAPATGKREALPRGKSTAMQPATVQALYNLMFQDATRYAQDRTPRWRQNVACYVGWHEGAAEIAEECFLGDDGGCLFDDVSDRDFLLRLFEMVRADEPSDRGDSPQGSEMRDLHLVAAHFMQRVLEPALTAAYEFAAGALSESGNPAPSPALSYAYLGAIGRRRAEVDGIDISGWTIPGDLVGMVVFHLNNGNETNVARLVAYEVLPCRRTGGR